MRDVLERLYMFWRRHEAAIVAIAVVLSYAVIAWVLAGLGVWE